MVDRHEDHETGNLRRLDGRRGAEHADRQLRDAPANLLEQLAAGATKASTGKPVSAARPANKGRSGGVVDAPGKKHRKPMPSDLGANIADSQAAKMRTVKTMVKTNRRRGRG